MGLFGIERLHPFDSRKYGRAWRCLRRHFGSSLNQLTIRPPRAIDRSELELIHTASYLDRLKEPAYVAEAIGIPLLQYLPASLLDYSILRPMRWATMGTIIAARESIRHEFVINLSGGFHHAKPSAGEGFCLYSDIALAIHALRREGQLKAEQGVAYIDLDAHQGNGVCHAFLTDERVLIFDMYNAQLYPSYDQPARNRIDCEIRLQYGCRDQEYCDQLESRLPTFLDSVVESGGGVAIYNAGTDVFAGDPLGHLGVTADGILRRDLYVIDQLRRRGIPAIMLLSGGYTRTSYRLVASSVIQLLEHYGK